MRVRLVLLTTWLVVAAGCAELNHLGAILQPPRFEQVPEQPAEIRLAGADGIAVRLWTRVTNPNPFGLTLGTLRGTLFLDESRAADAELPLGLPLGAGADRVIPIDISVRFSDLPALGRVGARAMSGQSLVYRLDGTIGVDAGRLGQPVFGPMTLVRGETRMTR